MSIRISTRELCRIVGIGHMRFNQLVSNGLFPWVQESQKKRAHRFWNADDVLTACVFHELVNDAVAVHRAARIANLVGGVARNHPDHSLIGYIENQAGEPQALAFHSLRDLNDVDMAHVHRLMIFHAAKYRAAINEQIASLQVCEAA
jgi:hypothetical protein